MSRVKMSNFIKIKHLVYKASKDNLVTRSRKMRGCCFISDINRYIDGASTDLLGIKAKRAGIRILLVKV